MRSRPLVFTVLFHFLSCHCT